VAETDDLHELILPVDVLRFQHFDHLPVALAGVRQLVNELGERAVVGEETDCLAAPRCVRSFVGRRGKGLAHPAYAPTRLRAA
jgi:hypothetical protein